MSNENIYEEVLEEVKKEIEDKKEDQNVTEHSHIPVRIGDNNNTIYYKRVLGGSTTPTLKSTQTPSMITDVHIAIDCHDFVSTDRLKNINPDSGITRIMLTKTQKQFLVKYNINVTRLMRHVVGEMMKANNFFDDTPLPEFTVLVKCFKCGKFGTWHNLRQYRCSWCGLKFLLATKSKRRWDQILIGEEHYWKYFNKAVGGR